MLLFFFFKQKTAYEMRISDWSSDVCSSDLEHRRAHRLHRSGQCARNLKAELGRPPGVDHGDRRARLRKAPFGVARAARGHNRSATHFDRGGNLVAVARRDQKDRLQATLHASHIPLRRSSATVWSANNALCPAPSPLSASPPNTFAAGHIMATGQRL